MKKSRSLVPAPFLLCMIAALGAGVLLPASAAEIGVKHAETSKKLYAKQDEAAARCKVLEAEKKYAEAIRLLREEVIEPLELEAGEVDSWIARQRLAEFTKELERLQLIYGNIKLAEAEKALIKGAYNDAIATANEASQIAPQLKVQAQALVTTANGRKNASARATKTSVSKAIPELDKRNAQVKRLLAEASTFYRNARYDEAMRCIEEVYAINPFSSEAAYLASQVYKKFYQIGNARRKADIAGQMSYEAWQWVEPAFPVSDHQNSGDQTSESSVKKGNDSAIQKKLDEIIFKSVSFNQTDMEGVIEALNDNKIHDPEEVGVVIDFIRTNKEKPAPAADEEKAAAAPGAGEEGAGEAGGAEEGGEEEAAEEEGDGEKKAKDDEVYVTLELKNVTLRQLLDYVCFLTDYTYVIRNDRVVFGAPDQQMIPAEYELKNSVKVLIVGKPAAAEEAPAEEGGEEGGEEGADAEGGEEGGDAEGGEGGGEEAAPAPKAPPAIKDEELTPALLQKFFSMYGIEFPKGSAISFYRGKLRMTNTQQNQLKMTDLLDRINVDTDMIEVEVKSIEIAESDMEELGFNWAFGRIVKSSDGHSVNGDYRVGSLWHGTPGASTRYDVGDSSLKLLDSLLSGIDSRVLKDFNIFPDLFGSFKPFGIDETFNLTLTINALDRSDRTEQISAPRVLVNNTRTAMVEMTKSYYFPEEWEELEIEMEEVGDQGGVRLSVTEPSPEFAEEVSKIGTKFTVTPTILDSKTIQLKLKPDITAWTGKDEYEIVARFSRIINDKELVNEMRWVIWRPVIAKRQLSVTVNVNHGETLVIGGLSDSKSQKRLDKVPILADIPFIGRLFQSQSETSTRNNMLIFVTARFVDNRGVPRPLDTSVGNGGIPGLVR